MRKNLLKLNKDEMFGRKFMGDGKIFRSEFSQSKAFVVYIAQLTFMAFIAYH